MAEINSFSDDSMRKLAELVRSNQRDLHSLKRTLAAFGLRRRQAIFTPPEVVPVHNVSGEEIPAHGVMRVTAVDDDGTHDVDKPNDTFKCRYLVNKSDAIPIDGYGNGTWLEKSDKVLYDTGTPAIDEEWGAKSGQWSLAENRPGFLITGDVDTTALTVRARQRIVTDLIGKPDANISLGSTGTVSISMGAQGAEAATEYDITCSAWGADVTANKKVVVFFRNGVWYVGPWECPV